MLQLYLDLTSSDTSDSIYCIGPGVLDAIIKEGDINLTGHGWDDWDIGMVMQVKSNHGEVLG